MPQPEPEVLKSLHEFFAAGYLEEPDASPMRRWSRAVRRRFENRPAPPYEGQLLYPSGPIYSPGQNQILGPSYSFTWGYNDGALQQRLDGADDSMRETLLAFQQEMRELGSRLNMIHSPHTVGGRGYTHSVPNYGRVLTEGLDGYWERIGKHLALASEQGDESQVSFYLGLQDVLAGIAVWHKRLVEHLRHVPAMDPVADQRRERLVAALGRVPFLPARDFFEAIVAYNLVYYLDDCDNPGRVDQVLWPYYERDRAEGRVNPDETVALFRNLWENCDVNSGWSTGIGGTTSEGSTAYNELTVLCLEAAHKIRRPNLQLHVRRDMPQDVWDAALDTIATGCGIPALYNEEEFLRALQETHLGIRKADLGWHNGGGCTETMIHGLSNVGSLDAGINLPLILVGTLNEALPAANSFEQLVSAYKQDVARTVREITDQVSADQEAKAQWRPQPMRSLLMDDCIENGVEFNAGGARYNWSVINVAGLANVIDSLAAIRDLVFDKQERTGNEILQALQQNYEGDDNLLSRLSQCPRFGNDDSIADEIAEDIATFVFQEFLRYAPWRGGKFLASCLMFVTYAAAGSPVAATPDGRRSGEPIADSAGPHQGRDKRGPTAMLKSVAKIPHHLAAGTLVVNARFTRDFFTMPEGREKIKQLVRTYFDLGGMQIQINVVDQAILQDAIDHPEQYEDLIVRVGGYSEYFNRLSPELKRTVLERTEHELA